MHIDRVQARNLAELMSGHRLGYDCLLLDVRDVEEFNLCHLKGCKPLPKPLPKYCSCICIMRQPQRWGFYCSLICWYHSMAPHTKWMHL